MKSIKRISAVLIAALLILTMIPFAANAATGTLKVICTKPGYTITVYEVATLNTNGTYAINPSAADNVKSEINKADTDTATLLTNLNNDNMSNYTAVNTLATSATKTEDTFTLDYGIYYVQTNKLANTKSVTNSVIVIDKDHTAETLDITGNAKINEGEPSVTKKIIEGSTEVDSTTLGIHSSQKTVTYKLKASITGSKDNKLKEYTIRDLMDTRGLTKADINIVSVTYEDETTSVAYSKTDDLAGKNKAGEDVTYTFGISINSGVLSSDDFYDHTEIVVKFTTTLATTAVNGTAYENHDDLYFKNLFDKEEVVDGKTVTVKTYKVAIKKYKAGTTTGLPNAKFKLFKKGDTSTILGYGKSDANGDVVFYTTEAEAAAQSGQIAYVKKGDYQVQEYEAPSGYNLNSSLIDLSEDGTNYIYSGIVYNTAAVLPVTGEAGTIAFTIAGVSLILLAGAMFVFVMKKRSTSK